MPVVRLDQPQVRVPPGGETCGGRLVTVTGFSAADAPGFPVLCDAHGNNVAFRCLGCGGPVLAVVREHQRGASPANPAVCPACGCRFWLEGSESRRLLVVHRVP